MHGSAPDIFGQGIANPIGMIWSGAMMLQFLGQGDTADSAACRAAHDAIVQAIEAVLVSGPKTPDLGGSAGTAAVGEAIATTLLQAA